VTAGSSLRTMSIVIALTVLLGFVSYFDPDATGDLRRPGD
jgi:hypothetical protein